MDLPSSLVRTLTGLSGVAAEHAAIEPQWMYMDTIFTKIQSRVSYLTQTDLDDWILPEICDNYKMKISAGAQKIYGYNLANVSLSAYREVAKIELKRSLECFLFRKQHWKNERDLNRYLLTTLKYLTQRSYWEQSNIKQAMLPVCPGCKFYNQKNFLTVDGKAFRCEHCFNEKDRLELELNDLIKEDKCVKLHEERIHIANKFSSHTRKGYRCEDCKRFLPASLKNEQDDILCPYTDCNYFGSIEDLCLMAHPTALSARHMFSLDVARDEDTSPLKNKISADVIDAETALEVQQRANYELSVLNSVIADQLKKIKRTNVESTLIQKTMMYQAFQEMINKYPREMVSYLVHQKQHNDFPVQSKIFQEYCLQISDSLPLMLTKNGEEIEVLSLSDPELNLFLGQSIFHSEVKAGGIVSNKTVETYTGGREMRFFGPCFIGMLLEVTNQITGESLMDNVKSYGFAQVELDDTVPVGTPVQIVHNRIPSHYELGHLVHLQRLRRQICDSIYLKLHGVKRTARRSNNTATAKKAM